MATVTPMLRVPNLREAIAWYEALGFRVTSTDADIQDSDEIGWCELCLEGAALMLRVGAQEDQHEHGDITLSFDVDNVEDLFAKLAHSSEVVYPPRKQPYGRLDFEVRDLNGFRLLFGRDLE